ncbi:MAG TPA: ParA family partition ATPase [Geminicoccaceae bacterium]|nr:ParA family partition ATPase [Geminicoccaceae bacterium]
MVDGAVITVAQRKGGAGKTTLAAQLAVAWWLQGRRVALLDIDEQGSLRAWAEVRGRVAGGGDGGLPVTHLSGWRLGPELSRLKGAADLILVDCPPHAETEARTAIRASDLVLVPCQPNPLDLWATRETLSIARREGRPALLVLNRVPPRGRSALAIRDAMAEEGLPLADASLGNRVAFAASMGEGRGVGETEPRSPAAEEIGALAGEVLRRLGGGRGGPGGR